MRARSLIAMVALAGILGGCSNNDNGTSGYGDNGKTGTRESAVVEITSAHSFSPREITLRTGDSVIWRNASKDIHTVTADPARTTKKDAVSLPQGAKPFHSGEIAPGKTWRMAFTTPGTYRYVCTLHENMTGTVVVKPTPESNVPSPY